MRIWKTLGSMLVLGMLVLAGCGPQAAVVQTPAKDLNLTPGDLAALTAPRIEGAQLSQEQDLEQLKTSWGLPNDQELSDANYRLFEHENLILMAIVITMKQPATSASLSDLTSGFAEGYSASVPEGTLQEVSMAKTIGDESTMHKAVLSQADVAVYFLGFRLRNVIGVLAAVGQPDFATPELVTQLGTTMAGKIK